MKDKDILIIGVGNILLGDEGIGVYVIRELQKLRLPENVELLDMGVATFPLMSSLAGRKKVIIVDAVKAGGNPGYIYRLLPDDIEKEEGNFLSLHDMGIASILATFQPEMMPGEIVIIGIEPGEIKWGMELSSPLKQKLPQIISYIFKEISTEQGGNSC